MCLHAVSNYYISKLHAAIILLSHLFVVIYIINNVTICKLKDFQERGGHCLRADFFCLLVFLFKTIPSTCLQVITDPLTVSWWLEGSQPSPLPAEAFQSHDADPPHLLS